MLLKKIIKNTSVRIDSGHRGRKVDKIFCPEWKVEGQFMFLWRHSCGAAGLAHRGDGNRNLRLRRPVRRILPDGDQHAPVSPRDWNHSCPPRNLECLRFHCGSGSVLIRHLTIPPNLCDLYVSVRDKHKYFIYLIKYKSYCITDYVRNEYTISNIVDCLQYNGQKMFLCR